MSKKKYESNAERQRAYRKRKATREAKLTKGARRLVAILDANKAKPDYAGFLRGIRQILNQ
jgi:hypothetical protein